MLPICAEGGKTVPTLLKKRALCCFWTYLTTVLSIKHNLRRRSSPEDGLTNSEPVENLKPHARSTSLHDTITDTPKPETHFGNGCRLSPPHAKK